MAVILIYLAFLTRSYFWDGVLFSYVIEKVFAGKQSWTSLPHANHLLYSVFGWVLYAAARVCRWRVRAIILLQIANALLAAAVANRLYAWVRKQTGSGRTAAFCTILFAFGATWWKNATDADPYIVSVALLLPAVLFAMEEAPHVLAAGACHVGAMLFHELAIFGYLPILAALAWKRRWPIAVAYPAATGGCVLLVYWGSFAAGAGAGHPTLLNWITHFAPDTDVAQRTGNWFAKNAASYAKLFAGGKFSLIRDTFSAVTAIGFAVLLAALAAFAARVRIRDNAGVGLRRPTRLVLWCWLIPYAIFLAWFDPGNGAHKLFLWPPLVLLLGTSNWSRVHARALTALAIALAAWNFGAFIYPHSQPDTDPLLAMAHKLNGEMPKPATVYFANFSPDDWYLAYFAPGRDWLPAPANVVNVLRPGVCVDTSEMRRLSPEQIASMRLWSIEDPKRNVKVGCW